MQWHFTLVLNFIEFLLNLVGIEIQFNSIEAKMGHWGKTYRSRGGPALTAKGG